MNVVYAFSQESTYLIESRENDSVADRKASAILQVRTLAGRRAFHASFLKKCEDVGQLLTLPLRIAGSCAGSCEVRCSQKKLSNLDVESFWSETAPLPPTAVLSAGLAVLPFTGVTYSSISHDDDDVSTEIKYHFMYDCFTNGPLMQEAIVGREGTVSVWRTYLAAVNTIVFDSNKNAAARFSLVQHVVSSTASGSNHNASVANWSEEVIWRLLNALVSVLAVYHYRGYHFGGALSIADIIGFYIPATLSVQLEGTISSIKGAEPWSDASTALFMKTVATSLILSEVNITAQSPCHRIFFVLNRFPNSMYHSDEESLEDIRRAQAMDIRSVGALLLTVVNAREKARVQSSASVSSELRFLLERMSTLSIPNAGHSQNHPSAANLAQLQALRLRCLSWHYQLVAEESQRLVRIARVGEPSQKNEKPVVRSLSRERETSLAERTKLLDARERVLHDREEKLNVMLQLYELTHKHLDMLPAVGSSAYHELRERICSMSPRGIHASTSVSPLLTGHSDSKMAGNTRDSSLLLDVSPLVKPEDATLESLLVDDQIARGALGVVAGTSPLAHDMRGVDLIPIDENKETTLEAAQSREDHLHGGPATTQWTPDTRVRQPASLGTPPEQKETVGSAPHPRITTSPPHTPSGRQASSSYLPTSPATFNDTAAGQPCRPKDRERATEHVPKQSREDPSCCTPKGLLAEWEATPIEQSHLSNISGPMRRDPPPAVAGVGPAQAAAVSRSLTFSYASPVSTVPADAAWRSARPSDPRSEEKEGTSPREHRRDEGWIQQQYETLAALRLSFQQATAVARANGESRSARASPRQPTEAVQRSPSDFPSQHRGLPLPDTPANATPAQQHPQRPCAPPSGHTVLWSERVPLHMPPDVAATGLSQHTPRITTTASYEPSSSHPSYDGSRSSVAAPSSTLCADRAHSHPGNPMMHSSVRPMRRSSTTTTGHAKVRPTTSTSRRTYPPTTTLKGGRTASVALTAVQHTVSPRATTPMPTQGSEEVPLISPRRAAGRSALAQLLDTTPPTAHSSVKATAATPSGKDVSQWSAATPPSPAGASPRPHSHPGRDAADAVARDLLKRLRHSVSLQ